MKTVFGERLKEALERSRMRNVDLARAIQDHTGASFQSLVNSIPNWISGKVVPSFDNLYTIAVVLEVSADWLLGLDDQHLKLPNDRWILNQDAVDGVFQARDKADLEEFMDPDTNIVTWAYLVPKNYRFVDHGEYLTLRGKIMRMIKKLR